MPQDFISNSDFKNSIDRKSFFKYLNVLVIFLYSSKRQTNSNSLVRGTVITMSLFGELLGYIKLQESPNTLRRQNNTIVNLD